MLEMPEPIAIELLGVARVLARCDWATVSVPGTVSLAQVLRSLAREFPALVGTALSEEGALLGGHVLSRNGTDLLRDPAEPIHPGDRLLLLSTSAGG
jgi:hypothetical protein